MKTIRCFPIVPLSFLLAVGAQAQIAVLPGGSAIISFGSRSPASEWSTRSLAGGDASFTSPAGLDAAVATNLASGVTTQVGDGLAANPPAANALAQWTSGGGGYVATRPTGVGATLLMATLRNDTGTDANLLDISYTLNPGGPVLAEQVPGHQVYYSLTGAANSWALISDLSGGATGTKIASVSLAGTWTNGARLYVLWADDNAPNGTDQAQQIDDVTFYASSIQMPLSVTLTAPPDGQLLVAPDDVVDVTLSAIAGGTVPATSVSFYTNGALFTTLTAPPYTAQLASLPAGLYALHAVAQNASETAASATSNIKVRQHFVNYTGGTFLEDFDSMGPYGVETPIGWYVGQNAPATAPAPGVNAVVGDGNLGPNGAIHAWNYGLVDDGNRALGTAPTANDRNTVLRLRNHTSSNLVAFEIFYDGEVWRPNTNIIESLTNYVSYDRGSNWTATGFDFTSPVAPVNPTFGINGHHFDNSVLGLGGLVTPPAPVPPGGIIYLRWLNFNEANTDGALAIDNFSFRGTVFSDASAITLSLTSPTNGQTYPGGCAGLSDITVTAAAGPFVTNVTFQLDGGAAVNDSTPLFSAVFSAVSAGPHILTAAARDSFDATSNVTVTITVLANQPAVIAFNNTYNAANTGLVFLVGTAITNQFSVTDSDGSVTNLEFLVNDRLHFTTNTSFGQIVVNNALAGASTFTVRATDNCGAVSQASRTLTITNPPAPVSVIVSNGSPWKYFASSNEPPLIDLGGGPIPWNAPAYDDSAWDTGFAELGGGDAVSPPNTNPERTLINIGPAGNRHRAAYFRHAFDVPDPSRYTALIVHSLQDDGSAVYLNGALVATFHLTNGVGVPITYSNLAGPYLGAPAVIGHDGTAYTSSNLTASLLPGQNVLAVEVHQDSIASSDISFDLMLWATGPVGVTLTITRAPDNSTYTVEWNDPLAEYKLQFSSDLSTPANWADVPGDPGSPYTQMLPIGSDQTFFRLQKRNP